MSQLQRSDELRVSGVVLLAFTQFRCSVILEILIDASYSTTPAISLVPGVAKIV